MALALFRQLHQSASNIISVDKVLELNDSQKNSFANLVFAINTFISISYIAYQHTYAAERKLSKKNFLWHSFSSKFLWNCSALLSMLLRKRNQPKIHFVNQNIAFDMFWTRTNRTDEDFIQKHSVLLKIPDIHPFFFLFPE